jgi:hypothetical protein
MNTSRDAVHTDDNYVITWDSQIVVKDLLQERLLVRVGHVTYELVQSVGSCHKDKVLLRAGDPVEFQSCDGRAVSLTDVKHLQRGVNETESLFYLTSVSCYNLLA